VAVVGASAASSTSAADALPSPTVVDRIDNLDRIADAVHTLRRAAPPRMMSVSLRPAELGHVQVDLSTHDGVLTVRLTADTAAGADSLRAATATLRRELEGTGLQLGDVGVDLGSGASRDQARLEDPSTDLTTPVGPARVTSARPTSSPSSIRSATRTTGVDVDL
jgi:flagellar hook-length control protein FliK